MTIFSTPQGTPQEAAQGTVQGTVQGLAQDRAGARGKIYEAALRLFAASGAQALSVSELADAAGIARGTVYNNIDDPGALFSDVAGRLAGEMIARVEATMGDIDDPAARLAIGLRLFVRRAHEEPDWGRFIARFAMGQPNLQHMMDYPPQRDLERAIETGRFKVSPGMAKSLVAFLNGVVISAIHSVITGHQTWREAGANAAELFLRAGGLTPAQAHRIAVRELPPLAPAPPKRSKKAKGISP